MAAIWLLALLAVSQKVNAPATLRAGGCAESDAQIAALPAGADVDVKFALNGCFLVSTNVDGKSVEGYVPGDKLSGAGDFERARRSANAVVAGAAATVAPPPEPPPSASNEIPHPDLLKARELIDQNRPSDALDIYLRYVKLAPRNAGLLASAGYAAYRADRIPDSLHYLRQSLAIEENPAVRRLLADIERESSADRSTEQKVGTRFVLRYDQALDPAVASMILAVLEQEFSRVQQRLGCSAAERIVTIVQTREQYRAATGAAEWSGALYDGKIRVPLVDRSGVSAETRTVFAHEIVHACLANLGRWPSWFHEGLAQQFAGQMSPAAERKLVFDMGRAGKLPPIGKLNSSWIGMNAAQAGLAYAIANVAMGEYLARHGDAGIRNAIANPDRLPLVAAQMDLILAGKE